MAKETSLKPAQKTAAPKKNTGSATKYYAIKDNTIVRLKKSCPKCGPGFFMAAHKDRVTCGKCQYCEFVTKDKQEKTSK